MTTVKIWLEICLNLLMETVKVDDCLEKAFTKASGDNISFSVNHD